MRLPTKSIMMTLQRTRTVVDQITLTVEVPTADTEHDTVTRVTGNARAGTLTIPASAVWRPVRDDIDFAANIVTPAA